MTSRWSSGARSLSPRMRSFDVVGRCHEVLALAEDSGQVEISFAVEGVRRFLLGRLMGEPGALDD